MSGEISFIEIGVDDLGRAREFYGSLFDWAFTDGPTGGMLITGSGVAAGMHGDDPRGGCSVFLGVDDLDAALERVRELGGAVDPPGSDDAAETVARFGRFALCTDDQGSRFGLHEARPSTRDVAGELVVIVDDWFRAIVANDAQRIGAFMAEDWRIVSESGQASKGQFLSLVRSGDLSHSAMARVGEPDVQVHGDCAVLTVRATNTAHYRGTRFDVDEWTTDVFVRRDGRWSCVLSHITPVASGGG